MCRCWRPSACCCTQSPAPPSPSSEAADPSDPCSAPAGNTDRSLASVASILTSDWLQAELRRPARPAPLLLHSLQRASSLQWRGLPTR